MKRLLLAADLACAAIASPCQAQDKTMRILVGFPPGGTTDLLGRLVADKLKDSLGQTVLVENRPGAIGAIAKALQHPDVVPKLVTLNMEASGSTPEEFRKVVLEDWNKWGAVVRASGFTLD